MIKKIRNLKYKFTLYFQQNILIPFFRHSKFLSNLYYFLFSKSFGREHQKVLQGVYHHLQQSNNYSSLSFILRRQIHRLEKGLSMKEKRSVFATDYILEAVKNLVRILNYQQTGSSIDQDFVKWCHDVLKSYFMVVSKHPNIDEAKYIFQQIDSSLFDKLDSISLKSWSPYPRKDLESKKIPTFNALYELAEKRRSVRWYLNKKVPRNLIEKAVSIATLSPSACNRQPFYYRVLDDEVLKDTIGAIPMGIRPFYRNIPVLVVLVGQLSAYVSERDRHVIYIDGGLSAMSFMLALETLGLSSVPINWPDIEKLEKRLEKQLGLEIDERPMLLIGCGYADPDGMIPYSQKKSPNLLIKYN